MKPLLTILFTILVSVSNAQVKTNSLTVKGSKEGTGVIIGSSGNTLLTFPYPDTVKPDFFIYSGNPHAAYWSDSIRLQNGFAYHSDEYYEVLQQSIEKLRADKFKKVLDSIALSLQKNISFITIEGKRYRIDKTGNRHSLTPIKN